MTAGWEIRDGDALERLREMPDESVQCCVTSPPYFGLRDYGTGEWDGGDDGCDHVQRMARGDGGRPATEVPRGAGGVMVPSGSSTPTETPLQFRDTCGKCGARRTDRQIGLEATPDEFVARLVEVFREVRRVLRDDGTLWCNIGDSYCSTAPGTKNAPMKKGSATDPEQWANERVRTPPGMKPKDLMGIPWLLAFALRADGWCLRSAIVWSKANPMPESVADRPTSAYEHVFLLSKCRWTGAEEPLPMREIDAAWLAAIVDGEGSICFQDRTSERAGQKTYSVRLSIVNTNRALLERVEEICGIAGVGSPAPRTRNAGESGRPVYAWQVTNAKAARVIAAIRPHLIAKRTQADLALFVQALNRKHTGRGGHSVSTADQAAKVRAAAACSALNRGQDMDLAWFTPVAPGRWVPLPYAYDADAIRERFDEPNGPYGTRRLVRPGIDENGGNVGKPEQFRGYLANGGRNKRNVWEIATQPYADAHFATFPCKLVEPCILAGSSPKACGECGAPWVRVTKTSYTKHRPSGGKTSRIEPPAYAEMARNRIRDDMPLFNWATEATA